MPGRRRLIGFCVAAAIGLLAMRLFTDTAPSMTPPSDLSREYLMNIASRINKTLPMMIDSETELTGTTALEGEFIYNGRLVNLAIGEMDVADFMAKAKQKMTNGACTTPATREYLKDGVTLRHTYSDKAFVHIGEFKVHPSSCGF
jgi:hypothetical protein